MYSYDNNLFTTCAGETIFGGYNKFGTSIYVIKNFINLPSHYSVEVNIKLYQLDTWDGEYFLSYVDSTLIISQYYIGLGMTPCGNGVSSYGIYNQILMGSCSHSDSTLNLYFSSTLDQLPYDESFGFKDLQVYLWNTCHYSCITCSVSSSDTSCLTCPSFASLSGGQCICKDKFYMEGSPYTYCAKCDISCATCDGASSSNCRSCYSGYILSSGTCIKPSSK